MSKDLIQKELVNSLTKIYYMGIIPVFTRFLEGEQAVLTVMLKLSVFTPTEICKLTGIAKNRMSAIIISLEKKGFISINTNSDDKRKINLSLTKKGRVFISAKIHEMDVFFEKFIDTVGEQNTKDLINIINLATANINQEEKLCKNILF